VVDEFPSLQSAAVSHGAEQLALLHACEMTELPVEHVPSPVHWLSNAALESKVKGLLSGTFVHMAIPGISLALQSEFWLESYEHVPLTLHEAHTSQSLPEVEQEPQLPAEHVWVPVQFPEPHAWVSPSSTWPLQLSSTPLHTSVAPGCIAEFASLQSSSG
jgi:hypothetical protein